MGIKNINKIEAILFLEAEPVEIVKLAIKIGLSEKECLDEIIRIKKKYQETESTFSLVFDEEKVQLVTKPELGEFVDDYFKSETKEQLSSAMLEVLSIISYKGPISKAEIEHIRGVNCSLILRKLTIKGLVEKKEKVKNSRIFNYQPGLKFLKKLGISELKDLPDYDKFKVESLM